MTSLGVRVLGVDPGFANIGFFGLVIFPVGEHPEFARVVTTKRESKKRRIRDCDDEHRRLEEIETTFIEILDGFSPDVVAAEEFPTHLPSSKTTKQLALVYGAIHAISRSRNLPFLNYAPQEMKLVVAKSRSASKTQVIDAIKKRFPSFSGWPSSKKIEHVADACGMAYLARREHLVGMLLRERCNDD